MVLLISKKKHRPLRIIQRTIEHIREIIAVIYRVILSRYWNFRDPREYRKSVIP